MWDRGSPGGCEFILVCSVFAPTNNIGQLQRSPAGAWVRRGAINWRAIHTVESSQGKITSIAMKQTESHLQLGKDLTISSINV